jgi:hypothetical protein
MIPKSGHRFAPGLRATPNTGLRNIASSGRRHAVSFSPLPKDPYHARIELIARSGIGNPRCEPNVFDPGFSPERVAAFSAPTGNTPIRRAA